MSEWGSYVRIIFNHTKEEKNTSINSNKFRDFVTNMKKSTMFVPITSILHEKLKKVMWRVTFYIHRYLNSNMETHISNKLSTR